MLGSGIIVFKDNEGRSQSWSNADLRLDVKVDPTMNLNVQAALERAVAAIKQRIGKAESEMDELSRKEYKTDRAERKRLVDIARLESRISMANLALEAEQKMQIRAERVIMPEGYKKPQPEVEHYHWRLDFDGHGELLVDAKTGEVHVAELPVL